MFIAIAIILVILWAAGFIAFHVAGFFIHILLLAAIVSLVFHFVRKV